MKKTVVFVEYPKCTTCKKAKEWLDRHGVEYRDRNIKEEKPDYEEMRLWWARSGFPVRRLFNTSGTLYRSMNLSEKIPQMSNEEMLRLLATDGMLVRRPILITDHDLLVGFNMADWDRAIDPKFPR